MTGEGSFEGAWGMTWRSSKAMPWPWREAPKVWPILVVPLVKGPGWVVQVKSFGPDPVPVRARLSSPTGVEGDWLTPISVEVIPLAGPEVAVMVPS